MHRRFAILTALLAVSICHGQDLAPTQAKAPKSAGASRSEPAIDAQTVKFRSDGETLSAYLAKPAGHGPFPAIVVIQEWWGLNDWIKQNAERFAAKGYLALAVDLYRGQVAKDQEMAHELMRGLPPDRAMGDLKAAVSYLKGRKDVDVRRIGSIGWCMGGGYSLQLGQASPDVKSIVICYGHLAHSPGVAKQLEGKHVLGIFGAQDRGIPADSVRAFEGHLKAAAVPNEFHIYDDAGHAFMNPNNKNGYRSESAQDAWSRIDAFFMSSLKKRE